MSTNCDILIKDMLFLSTQLSFFLALAAVSNTQLKTTAPYWDIWQTQQSYINSERYDLWALQPWLTIHELESRFALLAALRLLAAGLVAFLVGMKVLSAAICVAPLGGCALGIGLVFSGLLYGICRNPEAYDMAFGAALLGLAMIEVFAFLSLIVAGVIYIA